MIENYFMIGAVLVASLGGLSDLRSARIPNVLTYSGLLLALGMRLCLLGWSALMGGAAGMLAAGLLFFVLFVLGAMGGGDVKLMACVGAWVGSEQIIAVLLAAALAGGVLAMFYALCRQGIRTTFSNFVELIRFRLVSGLRPHPMLNVRTPRALRVPFGVAIAMGTLFCTVNVIWWR